MGKLTQPSAAPNNDLLVVWTPGPANDLNRPTTAPYYDAGLYIIKNSDQVWDPDDLIVIKNNPNFNEAWPRAVVPWQAVHGNPEPATRDWLPNAGDLHSSLPAGTPYGLVGSSSLYERESAPGRGSAAFDGLDPFNTSQNGVSSNWSYQGANAGKYENSDIWAIRLLAMEPNTDRRYGPDSAHHGTATDFYNHANERLRIMGEVPVRNDCGGCHAHSQQPLDFATTAANLPDYSVWDLSKTTPIIKVNDEGENELEEKPQTVVGVEFYQDIRPILQNNCISCHNSGQNACNLNLADISLENDMPGDYRRLARDESARDGYPPVIHNGVWRQTNASRYIRKFQSRRSLLTWKIPALIYLLYPLRPISWSTVKLLATNSMDLSKPSVMAST